MEAAIVYDVINNEEQDKETFREALALSGCNYLVLQKSIPWTGMRKKNTKKSQKLMSIVFIELTNSSKRCLYLFGYRHFLILSIEIHKRKWYIVKVKYTLP